MSDPPAVRLVPFSADHLDGVAELIPRPRRGCGSPASRTRRRPTSPPSGSGDTRPGAPDGTREAFAIVDAADGTFVGIAVAPEIDRESGTAELGYVVSPVARGRGVASEALRQLTSWALGEAELHRLELLISVENEASKRVARRGGYTFEGVLRSVYLTTGRREDTEIWSRLSTDPAALTHRTFAEGCSSGTSRIPSGAQHLDERRRRDDVRTPSRGPALPRDVAGRRPPQQLASRHDVRHPVEQHERAVRQ